MIKMSYLTVLFFGLQIVSRASMGEPITHQIIQKNKTFSQEEITIKVGDSIDFVNQDEVTHHLFNPKEFKINIKQNVNQTSNIKFDTPAEGYIRCAIHPKMKIKVIVK